MIEINPDLLRRALAGDPDAHEQALALLPKEENIFGRWATHQDLGRVVCINAFSDKAGEVWAITPDKVYPDGAAEPYRVSLAALTFDPVELVAEEDFRNAPEGTVVANEEQYPCEKHKDIWHMGFEEYNEKDMANRGPWHVVRWGKGELA